MTSLRQRIINPKQNPFPRDAKAACIYITSPHKDNDAPIDADASVKRLNGRHQLVQNTKSAHNITWQDAPRVEQKAPRPTGELHWSLWVEAHGAPMWFFGAEATLASERLGTREFALWMKNCETANDISFNYVVLDSCCPTTENLYLTAESLRYCKEALVREFGITRSTSHVVGPVPTRADEPKVVTKLPKKALDHLKQLNKIWTNIQQPSFFR